MSSKIAKMVLGANGEAGQIAPSLVVVASVLHIGGWPRRQTNVASLLKGWQQKLRVATTVFIAPDLWTVNSQNGPAGQISTSHARGSEKEAEASRYIRRMGECLAVLRRRQQASPRWSTVHQNQAQPATTHLQRGANLVTGLNGLTVQQRAMVVKCHEAGRSCLVQMDLCPPARARRWNWHHATLKPAVTRLTANMVCGAIGGTAPSAAVRDFAQEVSCSTHRLVGWSARRLKQCKQPGVLVSVASNCTGVHGVSGQNSQRVRRLVARATMSASAPWR